MQLGFVSAVLPDEPLPAVLGTAADLGYDCVELMCWPPGGADRRYAGVTHVDCTHFGDAEAEAVRGACEAAGVAVSGLGYYPNPLSRDAGEAKSAVAHLRRVIEAAAALGVNRVNSFAGRDHTRSVDENWPRFLDTWGPLVELAASLGVRVGIENCPMLFTADEWPGGKNLAHSPAIWRRMFADLPDPHFGLNYDPSHPVWLGMDPVAPVREFADRIFHVHAKDVRVDRAKRDDLGVLAFPNLWHDPVLPGLGEVDWGAFFAALGAARYRGPVCVEVEDRSYEHSAGTRRLALTQSHTFLRNFIPSSGRAS